MESERERPKRERKRDLGGGERYLRGRWRERRT